MSRLRSRVGTAVAATVLVVSLSACTAPDTRTDALQDGVVAIATVAASGDATGALAQADALAQQIADALEQGLLTADEAARIQAALDLVRADLTAMLPAPEVTETPDVVEDSGGSEPETPVVDDAPESNNGNNGNGPGSNNGNGPGSDNGKGKDAPGKDKPGKGKEKGNNG